MFKKISQSTIVFIVLVAGVFVIMLFRRKNRKRLLNSLPKEGGFYSKEIKEPYWREKMRDMGYNNS